MTKLSTALVLVSGRGFGPFKTEGWRISGSVEVVEGSGSGPFLLCSSVEAQPGSERSVVLITNEKPSTMGKALLIAVSHLVGGELCDRLVADLPLQKGASGEIVFTDPSHVTEDIRVGLARELISRVRLGVVELEPDTVLNGLVLDFLGEAGFRLDVFAPTSGAK